MCDKEKGLMEKLMAISSGLSRMFPNGNEPFQIMTRLLEECGELAEQVGHFQGNESKVRKHGEPDRTKLAKEVQDVIRCALQIAQYYQIEPELEASIERCYRHEYVSRD